MDYEDRISTLQYLTDFFSWPDNNGRDPDNECMLIHVALLYWFVKEA